MAVAVLVHVAPHQQRVDGDEGEALRGLVVGVGRHRQPGRGIHTERVGHLLDAYDDDDVRHPAGDGDDSHPQRCRAGGAGRLDLQCLRPPQPGKVGDQRAQVFLADEFARQHIAHVEHIDPRHARVGHAGLDRVQRQVAQADVPMFSYSGLPNTDDGNVSHSLIPSGSP